MRRVTALAVVFAWLLSAGIALADALVVVKLRDSDGKPAEGKVTLVPVGKGEKHSCKTSEGTCRISGVPGGSYKVTVKPASGTPPPSRKAMIPPSGKVELFVSTGAAGS